MGAGVESRRNSLGPGLKGLRSDQRWYLEDRTLTVKGEGVDGRPRAAYGESNQQPLTMEPSNENGSGLMNGLKWTLYGRVGGR